MSLVEPIRPSEEWLEDFKKTMATSGSNKSALKVTIADIAERSNDPKYLKNRKSLLPTSPRSVEAALTAGIDPYTLVHRPVEFFARPGQPQEITQLIYEEAEQVRRDKLDRLVRERARMVELDEQGRFKATFTGAKGSASRGANFDEKENEMVEKEAKRLAMLKERQQKELEQVRKYEETRLKIMLENEEALKREKHKGHEETLRQKQRDREWGEKQRVTELKKLQEEQELEKEQRRRDQIAYQKELEDLERQAKEEAVRRKLAYQRDQEAKIKAAAAKAETERLLREQQEAVERRRQEMDRKDAERRKMMAIAQIEQQKADEEARAKADARRKAAKEQNENLLKQMRAQFDQKEREAEERRRQSEEAEKQAIARKAEAEAEAERKRQEKFRSAQLKEESRKAAVVQKAQEKEEQMLQHRKQLEMDMLLKKTKARINHEKKMDHVIEHSNHMAYQKEVLLKKITDDSLKARKLQLARETLRAQRCEANMKASRDRQSMMIQMDTLRKTGKLPS